MTMTLKNKLSTLQALLQQRGETIATAESCTGGLVGGALTEMSGSSVVFVGGIIAYANRIKEQLLGVSPDILARVGAVSEEVAKAMAIGAKAALGSTYAVSLTGIAGPDGGTPAKPVGTVWCGIAHPGGVEAVLFELRGSRAEIRAAAVENAVAEALRIISKR